MHTTTSPGVLEHHCSIHVLYLLSVTLNFYFFTYQSMLEYAYYNNLSFADKSLFHKCHTFHNELYHDVFQILKETFVNIYSIFYIWQTTMKKLLVCELCMIRASVLHVALDLGIDFQDNPGLISFHLLVLHDQITYSNLFLY